MPDILNSPELFLFLVVDYRITDDTRKLTGNKMEFNESLVSA